MPGIYRFLMVTVFFLLHAGKICSINKDFETFIPINTSDGLSDNQIRFIQQLPDGRMVFTTFGNVNIYDGVHFRNIHNTEKSRYILKNYNGFYRIYHSSDSLLWIKDYKRLSCINLYREQYISNIDSMLKTLGAKNGADDLFVDNDGRTWIVASAHLTSISGKESIKLNESKERRLQDVGSSNNNIYLFFSDGSVECHTIMKGCVNKKYSVGAYAKSEYSAFNRTSLIVKSGDIFYQLRNGNKGGMFAFDTKSRKWSRILEKDYTLNTLIVAENTHTAYISCTKGFWEIDLTNGKSTYHPAINTESDGNISTEISTLFIDRQGGLWMGTYNRGLFYSHPNMYSMQSYTRNSFPDNSENDLNVLAFAEDSKGTVYLRTKANCYRISKSPIGTLILQKMPLADMPADRHPRKTETVLSELNISANGVTAMCKDKLGRVWIGTADGLLLYSSDGKQARKFYSEDGLSNNFIQSLLEAYDGTIWTATSNGISAINVKGKDSAPSFTVYRHADGTLEGEYSPRAIFQAKDSTLYFGGVDGFTVFHPSKVSSAKTSFPAPVFTSLTVNGTSIKTGREYEGNLILTRTAPYTDTITLNYNQNFISLQFSAPDFVNRQRLCYRYKLEGIDRQWNTLNTASAENTSRGLLNASYTDLQPGKYTLTVYAGNGTDFDNAEKTTVTIIITPPWWKTTTAYVIYILLLAAVIFAVLRTYTVYTRRKLERKHKEELLLARIRGLIEQCDRYEAEQKASKEACADTSSETDEERRDEEKTLSAEDSRFIAHAVELVEKNIHSSGYSVEQLAKDLCMERTGLYRKLQSLLEQSPSYFIRDIRLRRARNMLAETDLTIAEIAEQTGFSSASYFTRCFQEAYGCKPSEYARNSVKTSTIQHG